MKDFVFTEENKKILEEHECWMKKEIGSFDVEECYSGVTEKFDRRKFGKVICSFCNKKFNPFYYKSLKKTKDWEWRWRYDSHKEPECDYKVECPGCKE